MILVCCFASANFIFIDVNIDLDTGMFKVQTMRTECHYLYLAWIDFNHAHHIVITYWCTHKNFQLSTTIGGCELPTKWTETKSNNDSNNNFNPTKRSIAWQRLHPIQSFQKQMLLLLFQTGRTSVPSYKTKFQQEMTKILRLWSDGSEK